MYDEILKKLELQLPNNEFKKIRNRSIHLGIFSEPYLTYMLDGKKTIESRFSKKKIAPYNQIKKEDIVIVKKSGDDVVAYFTIKEVFFYDLRNTTIGYVKNKYNESLCVSEDFWKLKSESNYATIIIIDKLIKLKPFSINKKGMQTWIKF